MSRGQPPPSVAHTSATGTPTPGAHTQPHLPATGRVSLVGEAPRVGTREHWLESHVADCACHDCYVARGADLDHHHDYMNGVI